MQKLRKWTIIFLLLLPVMLLVGMRVGWWFVPQKTLVVLAIDKAEITLEEQAKQPLFWVLKHNKYVRRNGVLYDGRTDYLGFSPLENKQYQVRDFHSMTEQNIRHIVSNIDVTYYIGSSGASSKKNENVGFVKSSMTEKDMYFLREMKKAKKLIITEFAGFGSSVKANVRREFENEFGVRWSGWIGCYFSTLDSTNIELPQWLVSGYMKQHGGKWPFTDAGLVFIHESGTIEVLDGKIDLDEPKPIIHTFAYGVNRLGMIKEMPYTGWFNIVQMVDSSNHAISTYWLKVNDRGQKLLNKSGIPVIFPAVIMHKAKDYEFYYFCGNYSDNKIPSNSSYFIGGQHMALMLDGSAENQFFYRFFSPMISSILLQYYNTH
jgi:hypothetical protein